MQRYGQTIAVTVEDLTRSDDGKAIMSMNNYLISFAVNRSIFSVPAKDSDRVP